MKILLNMMRYDYGDKSRGLSFEYTTFGNLLEKVKGAEVELFDYAVELQSHGKEKMNERLIEKCKNFSPDLIFTFIFENELNPETLEKIREYSKASITWMADDKWRWESTGRKYCHYFDYVITTDPEAIGKYLGIGYHNAILSQWAIDEDKFKKMDVEKDIEVSFVGGYNSWRNFVVKELSKKGIRVECFGFGWENGRVSESEMVEIFNRSKINLNISNSVKFNIKYLLSFNWGWDKEASFVRNIYKIFGAQINTLISKKRKEDIKARFFEVIGSSGFLLSYDVNYLSEYLNIGEELDVYDTINNLEYKIRYYLENEKERSEIAQKGYVKVCNKHTYAMRFKEIFKILSEKEKAFSDIKFIKQ